MYMHGAPEDETASTSLTERHPLKVPHSASQSTDPRHSELNADGGRDAFIAGVRDIGTTAAGLECAIFQS